jgi:ABC-type sugar transport system ATPase subunit
MTLGVPVLEEPAPDRQVGRSSIARIELRGLSKRYGATQALADVSLRVMSGEIHAIAGENGAGKSTLIKCLSGVVQPDDGEILIDGVPAELGNPAAAARAGVSVVHQELVAVESMSVMENLVLGQQYARGAVGLISWRKLRNRAREALDAFGLDIDPRAQMRSLSLASQQMVTIVRASLQAARVMVYDEPTAPLTEEEVTRLIELVRSVQERGVASIYITHRLEEIDRLADRVTVLKDGRWVTTRDVRDVTRAELAYLIVGRAPEERFDHEDVAPDAAEPILELRKVSTGRLRDINFQLRAGEVVGLAGLTGSGRSHLARCVAGCERVTAGHLLLKGKPIKFATPTDAIRVGIAMVPEDRKLDGLIASWSAAQNMSLPWLGLMAKSRLLITRRRERQALGEIDETLQLRGDLSAPVKFLSGGNQQKVLLGRWVMQDAKRRLHVLALDEPTAGIDVGAKEEIYRLIRHLQSEGLAILLISSELDELEGLCQRVLVLRDGRIVDELRGAAIRKEHMLNAAFGHTRGR